ncbi:D-alanine--D-alanine ligase family protein [Singulisphaera sp. PoT]|uniref:D-alanine--D-alanine ligase family protein n=1 Tax=Singulisphaera sp. PoT TaxID=3411797 RepID=UPI003BF56218
MRIGIAFDLAPVARDDEGPDDRFEEYDKPQTIESLAQTLREEGHEVVLLGDGRELLEKVLADPPDFVWNVAEGEGVGRSREARVPAALEMLGIPYSGSDPLTMAVALEKDVAKRLVGTHGVVTPRGVCLSPETSADRFKSILEDAFSSDVGLSLILKPVFEGSSKGIRAHSLVRSFSEAAALARQLVADYHQPILVEEFIAGDEVTVGVLGNGSQAEILGAMRIRPKVRNDQFIYSLEVKRDWDDRVAYETPAQLDAAVLEGLYRSTLAAFSALGCRDVARIDFRIRGGVPYFIEANPLPGLAPDWSDLVILAKGMGVSYRELIGRILASALERTGKARPMPQGAIP